MAEHPWVGMEAHLWLEMSRALPPQLLQAHLKELAPAQQALQCTKGGKMSGVSIQGSPRARRRSSWAVSPSHVLQQGVSAHGERLALLLPPVIVKD